MKVGLRHKFEDIISLKNLFEAWQEFVQGKKKRQDVQMFSLNLADHIFSLRLDLSHHNYKHGDYQAFNICDPKPRQIHKATVRDCLFHRAVYRILYPYFAQKFIADSFSSQLNKGTHKAINRFRNFGRQAGQNHTQTVWALKGDIKKFFASIDQKILIDILKRKIIDQGIIELLEKIIFSFNSGTTNRGLPLGNLTSQLLVNIYLNNFPLR